MASDWRVHKFGGSSVADCDGYRRVARNLDPHVGFLLQRFHLMDEVVEFRIESRESLEVDIQLRGKFFASEVSQRRWATPISRRSRICCGRAG